jgi:hypothetical protein
MGVFVDGAKTNPGSPSEITNVTIDKVKSDWAEKTSLPIVYMRVEIHFGSLKCFFGLVTDKSTISLPS